MKITIAGFRATDDPTMASLPWVAAKAAYEQGDQVVLWLFNEAANLARVKGSALDIQAPGLPPLREIKSAVEDKITIKVCKPCWEARNPDLKPQIGILAGMPEFVTDTKTSDKTLTF